MKGIFFLFIYCLTFSGSLLSQDIKPVDSERVRTSADGRSEDQYGHCVVKSFVITGKADKVQQEVIDLVAKGKLEVAYIKCGELSGDDDESKKSLCQAKICCGLRFC